MTNKLLESFLMQLLFFFVFLLESFGQVSTLTASPVLPNTNTTSAALMRCGVTGLAEASSQPDKKEVKNTSLKIEESTPQEQQRSQVFFLLQEGAINPAFQVNTPVVKSMLTSLVCAVTGKPTTNEAWRSLLKVGEKGDRVGIKVATEAGISGGTHIEVVVALIEQLVAAGVEPGKIIVWDRRKQDLEAAGYITRSGINLRWIDHGNGYDARAIFSSPIIGQLVYGDLEFKESPHSLTELLGPKVELSNNSHYARTLVNEVDKVINLPSLCDSYHSGIHGALANMTLDNIDNWRRFTKAPYFGDPAIADLYSTDSIHQKVIMTIMDALALQYAGGPGADPAHVIPYATLLASRDPVAIDATAIALIDEQRIIAHLPKLGEIVGHVQTAESLKLGNALSEKIQMIRLGNKKTKAKKD